MKDKNQWLQNESSLYSIMSKNGYQTSSPHIRATGFRMHALLYSEREQFNLLAETFLINSFLQRNDPEGELSISSYLTDEGIKMVSLLGCEDSTTYETFPLTSNESLELSLGECLVARRSIRDFTADPIPYNYLSTLLRATTGIASRAQINLKDTDLQLNLRTIPSGGSLYPISTYIVALNVKDLPTGIYSYDVVNDKLVLVADKEIMPSLLKSFAGLVDMVASSHAGAIFLFVGKPWRSMRKYGTRGLRFMFQEVGSLTQNLHLSVTSLGLGSVDCASFFEQELNDALGLDGVHQCVLHTVLTGMIP